MVSSKIKQIYLLYSFILSAKVYLFWRTRSDVAGFSSLEIWQTQKTRILGSSISFHFFISKYFKILWNSFETVSARTIEQMNPHPNGQWGSMGNDSRHCGIHILSDLCATCDTVKDLFNLTLDLQDQCYGSLPTLQFPIISNSLCHCSKFVCVFFDFVYSFMTGGLSVKGPFSASPTRYAIWDRIAVCSSRLRHIGLESRGWCLSPQVHMQEDASQKGKSGYKMNESSRVHHTYFARIFCSSFGALALSVRGLCSRITMSSSHHPFILIEKSNGWQFCFDKKSWLVQMIKENVSQARVRRFNSFLPCQLKTKASKHSKLPICIFLFKYKQDTWTRRAILYFLMILAHSGLQVTCTHCRRIRVTWQSCGNSKRQYWKWPSGWWREHHQSQCPSKSQGHILYMSIYII